VSGGREELNADAVVAGAWTFLPNIASWVMVPGSSGSGFACRRTVRSDRFPYSTARRFCARWRWAVPEMVEKFQ